MNKNICKVCIVTGSTSGIGLETAKALAKMGMTVVMVARDEQRGKMAHKEVVEYSNNDRVALFYCDFSSLQSIISFVDLFKKKYNRLDILINNAGMMSKKRVETAAGIELTFAVNHLGYFSTTNLLLDMIKQTPHSRVIVVSSDLHAHGQIDLNNLMRNDNYHGFAAYCDSKLANLLFAYQLNKKISGTNTTVNALHPGVIKTKFSIEDRNSNMTFPMGRMTPEEGARAQIYLSTSNDIAGISGKYFNEMQMEESSSRSYDQSLADGLWERSLDLTRPSLVMSA